MAAALCTIALATLIGTALAPVVPEQSVPLVFLLAVVLAAVCFGTGTGVSAAVLAFFAFNFFFISPVYTFTVGDPQDLFALVVFLGVAVFTGSLAGRMREEADRARTRAAVLQSLNTYAGTLSGATSLDQALGILAAQVAETVRGSAIVFAGDATDIAIRAEVPAGQDLQPADWQAAQRAHRSGSTIYAPAPGWPGAAYEFRPIGSSNAVIGIRPPDGRRSLSHDEEAALQIVLQHAAIVIERTRLEKASMTARETAERERMRAALLSSLSHDLRTPLASILGAVTSLRQLGAIMTKETHDDLLAAIEEETERLTHFVSNLLDMTKLETDAIDLMHDWVDPADAVQHATAHARSLFPAHQITLQCPANTPIVRGDATLLEHVIFNLLDNAIKFSDADAAVTVTISFDDVTFTVSVEDSGIGIAPEALPHIFEKFYRARSDDRRAPGTGLGLAICQRVIAGMNGSIDAVSPIAAGRGTRVTVRLPVAPRLTPAAAADAEHAVP